MSAGSFVNATYEADYGAGTAIHPIRVQPETIDATAGSTGNGSGGAATNPISAQVSAGKRRLGLHARTVRLKLAPETTPPANYSLNSVTVIPCLNKAFATAVATKGTGVTYLETAWVSAGFSAERVV